MAALTDSRNTPELQDDKEYFYPVEANTSIFMGGIVALNAAGNLVPMSVATTQKVVGRAEMLYNEQFPGQNAVNNPGAAGAMLVKARRGIFLLNNAGGGDAIAQANVGGVAFALDDNTAASNDGGATRSAMGRIVGIDISGMIWVDTRFPYAIAS